MLDGNDKETFYALRQLRDVVDKHEKPVIIWAGAGVGKWCGFPDWQETGEHFHKIYRRFEHQYDRIEGERLLREEKFPELFETCRDVNRQRYNQQLAAVFSTRALTPVYVHLLRILSRITPLQIVTTNIDETLERNLPASATVQKSDLERCLDILTAGQSFVAKLHGSISSVETVVFTKAD
jgi:NAD-dependent SIR2 family protein deacetylase